MSKLNETILIKSDEYTLATNECNQYVERGYLHQKFFRKDYLPIFEYHVKDVCLSKRVAMKYGENKVAVHYSIRTGKEDISLEIRPLVNFRNFHELRNCFEMPSEYENTSINLALNSHGLTLHMATSEGEYIPYQRVYYKNMFYRVESDRGLDAYECHAMPGTFKIMIPKNSERDIEFVA